MLSSPPAACLGDWEGVSGWGEWFREGSAQVTESWGPWSRFRLGKLCLDMEVVLLISQSCFLYIL